MSEKPGRFWAWIGKAMGPHEPSVLVALPGFGPETQVAPEGRFRKEDWRKAREVPEVANVLANGGSRPPARSERDSPTKDIPDVKCSECGTEGEPEDWFCSNCQQPLVFRACPHCGTSASGDAVICSKCIKPLPPVPRLPAVARLADLNFPSDEAVTKAVRNRLARGWFFRPEVATGLKVLEVEMLCALETTIDLLEERMQIKPIRGRARKYAGIVGNLNEIAPPTSWMEAWHSYHFRLAAVSETHTCSRCGGRGWTPCKQMEPCHCMSGRDRFNCIWCRATGWRECNICNGTGQASCDCEGGLVHTHLRLDVGRQPKVLSHCRIPSKWSDEVAENSVRGAEGVTAFMGGGEPGGLLSLQWRRLPHAEICESDEEAQEHAEVIKKKWKDYQGTLASEMPAKPDLADFVAGGKPLRLIRSARLEVRLIPLWRVEYEFDGHRNYFLVLGTNLTVRRVWRWRLLDWGRVVSTCAVAVMLLGTASAFVMGRMAKEMNPAIGPNPRMAVLHARPPGTGDKAAVEGRIGLVARDLRTAKRLGDESATEALTTHLARLKSLHARRWKRKRAPNPRKRTTAARPKARKANRAPRSRSPAKNRALAAQRERERAESTIRDLMGAKNRAADMGDIAALKAAEADYKKAVDAYIERFGELAWQGLRRSLANEEAGTANPVTGEAHPRSKGRLPRRSGLKKDATKMSVDELEQYLRGLGNGSK